MGHDIVEIALDYATDFRDFEKLASEIMRNEGYQAIRPLGGIGDDGRDAVEESFSQCEGKYTTVFQYTLQRELASKIENTIDKLARANIQFNELVIVTPRELSTSLQDNLRRKARTKFSILVNIFERKTIVNRLADYSNGIFHRHFPDIDRQLKDMKSCAPSLASEDATELEMSLLRAALSITFDKDSEKVRDSILDQLTLSIILKEHPNAIVVSELASKYESLGLQSTLSDNQVSLIIERLKKNRLLTCTDNHIAATELAINSCSATMVEVEEATSSLIFDIVAQVVDTFNISIPKNTIEIIGRNAKNTLALYFRIFGIELSNRFLTEDSQAAIYLDGSNLVVKEAKKDLPVKIGEALLSSIADMLTNPPEDHAKTLAHWSLSYLGIQIMNLDPTLQEFEKSRFAKKTFILDTDFVLDCIVREHPINETSLAILKGLLRLGCRLIIPEAVIIECITHAEISSRTYNYFSEGLFSYDESYVNEMVWNAFVKGYYYAYRSSTISNRISYGNYISNYYDEKRPGKYFLEIITNILPDGIEILNPTSLLSSELPEKQMDELKDENLEMICQSKKSVYRSDQENEDLAETDARFFLTALYLNKEDSVEENLIFGGLFYIITSSPRYIKAAYRIGIRDVVTVRPQAIVSLMEIIGVTSVSPNELIRLFENPFLIHAVMESKDEVRKLVESGVDLKGKSLVRLRWDLDEVLHSKLALIEQIDLRESSSTIQVLDDEDEDELMELLKAAIERGYSLSPRIKSLYERLQVSERKTKEKTIEYVRLKADFETLEGKFREFGKRKEKYLRRMARKLGR